MNFDLASSNVIILTATDGVLIDQIDIASDARGSDVVYGRVDDSKDIDSWEVKVMPTPGQVTSTEATCLPNTNSAIWQKMNLTREML